MKVIMAIQTSIGANATVANVFSGETYERAPFNATIDLLWAGSAIGIQAQLVIGGNLVVSRQVVNTNNRVPIVPDDLVIGDVPVLAGQLVQLTAFNTTAGALTLNARVEYTQAMFR